LRTDRRRDGGETALRSFLGALLERRDWVYLLSLLVPFVVYDLALKASNVVSQPGLALVFDLMRSDVFFDLGYALFWVGMFALVRRGYARRVVVVLFHAVTMLVVLVSTFAYQYFRETGTTLDYGVIAAWLPNLQQTLPIITQGVPLSAWLLLAVAVFYVTTGPWLVTRILERRRGWLGERFSGASEVPFSAALGLFLIAIGFGSLSLLVDSGQASASKTFARDPLVNVVLTGVEEAYDKDRPDVAPAESPAAGTSLAPTSATEKRNVVLIHLESTRAGATTPYNTDLQTTSFLNELAKNSLLASRYYTTVPHSSKASVSVNCGIEPHLVQPVTESKPDGIPAPCLADLLKDQGYDSALFQSSTEDFEDFRGLVKNFGYEEYYPLESMNPDGFKKTNYFGYEDDIMLEPSKDWLEDRGNDPFVAEYLLGTGHHDYQCLGTSYGQKYFSDKDLTNRYLNCIRLQDIFLKNLFEQYKELGLYEDTIFVIYGDHGEAFAEHGRFQHDDVAWEEGLKVPLIIHAPGLFEGGKRVNGLSNHTDVLPTVLEMLGYTVQGGEYPGYSLLHQIPEDRTLRFSCFHQNACLASLKGYEKYIYHYDNRPDELFDLSKDPLEKQNLAGEQDEAELDKRRADLLAWRSEVDAAYNWLARGSPTTGSEEDTSSSNNGAEDGG
jgi:lipoteichoic acid synthase